MTVRSCFLFIRPDCYVNRLLLFWSGAHRMAAPAFSAKPTPKNRQAALNAKYGHPLPILLPNSTQSNIKGKSRSLLSSFTSSTDIVVPQCKGVYDPITRSVLVTDREDMDILFRRGFFGKGTLSRSEPSWKERRVDLLKGGSSEFIINHIVASAHSDGT